ncbi:MAG TPA: RIP metalloprotease RseP [Clostridiales bacterium]|nr:RIP metalloprotease RseP [Clostridiales bacterium]
MNIIVALLILGVIVLIHELGHFLLAKANGVTVTEFSIGMGPRLASVEHKGTKYSLKVLPIGGSCMMLGEDESIDDEGAFNKKGVWARFSVIFAGAFFNFILAYVLSLIFIGNVGVDKPIVTGTVTDGASEGIFQEGDEITAINGSPIHFSREINYYFYFNPISEKPVEITYNRDGAKKKATIVPKWMDSYMLGCNYTGSSAAAKMETVLEGYPLAEAGLKVGDVIVNINGTEIDSGKALAAYLDANPLTGEKLSISYVRNGHVENPVTTIVVPKLVDSSYSIGWKYNSSFEKGSALEVVKYSFYEVKLNIVNTLKGVLYLVTGKARLNEIAGPVGIVNYVDDIVTETKSYGVGIMVLSLIEFSIMISANLGVMNLLPFPALDGGRLVFILIEAVFRKPVPKEKEAMVHMVGMALLMALMVFVLFNDVRNIFG